MTQYYRVFNHGHSRMDRRFSINQTNSEGRYICQEAYWYKNSTEAKTEAARLIAEDAKRGVESLLLDSVGGLSEL